MAHLLCGNEMRKPETVLQCAPHAEGGESVAHHLRLVVLQSDLSHEIVAFGKELLLAQRTRWTAANPLRAAGTADIFRAAFVGHGWRHRYGWMRWPRDYWVKGAIIRTLRGVAGGALERK